MPYLAVVEQRIVVVEERRGNDAFPVHLPLLLQHGVVAANGAFFQPNRGAAPIQDEYQFCQILLHSNSPSAVSCRYSRRAILLAAVQATSVTDRPEEVACTGTGLG